MVAGVPVAAAAPFPLPPPQEHHRWPAILRTILHPLRSIREAPTPQRNRCRRPHTAPTRSTCFDSGEQRAFALAASLRAWS
ncbi:hypothetical protein BS78_04G102900 [Paspalum vaginatum]|nr:hypothetical protein BS78_04G102900 [Paspalum vaginatum]